MARNTIFYIITNLINNSIQSLFLELKILQFLQFLQYQNLIIFQNLNFIMQLVKITIYFFQFLQLFHQFLQLLNDVLNMVVVFLFLVIQLLKKNLFHFLHFLVVKNSSFIYEQVKKLLILYEKCFLILTNDQLFSISFHFLLTISHFTFTKIKSYLLNLNY